MYDGIFLPATSKYIFFRMIYSGVYIYCCLLRKVPTYPHISLVFSGEHIYYLVVLLLYTWYLPRNNYMHHELKRWYRKLNWKKTTKTPILIIVLVVSCTPPCPYMLPTCCQYLLIGSTRWFVLQLSRGVLVTNYSSPLLALIVRIVVLTTWPIFDRYNGW